MEVAAPAELEKLQKMKRKVIIQKVDMDTALTAFLLGVSERDEIVAVRDQANEGDLANPEVICIECGGSGQADLKNFDHHDTDQMLPSACVQACRVQFGSKADQPLKCLVEYVNALDTQGPELLKQRSHLPQGAFPTLSDIFAGMLLITKDPKEQLLRGLEICRVVLQDKLDPFSLMPERLEWSEYIEAKRQNDGAIQKALDGAQFFKTKTGRKVGFVETNVMGALGALYPRGCQIAIAYSPHFGNPPLPKYTIAGDGIGVDVLLPIFDEKESCWGGPAHGTIIGSPRTGSKLTSEQVIQIVQDNL
jgi:hypothetical protein